jgi:hypothetical protein
VHFSSLEEKSLNICTVCRGSSCHANQSPGTGRKENPRTTLIAITIGHKWILDDETRFFPQKRENGIFRRRRQLFLGKEHGRRFSIPSSQCSGSSSGEKA